MRQAESRGSEEALRERVKVTRLEIIGGEGLIDDSVLARLKVVRVEFVGNVCVSVQVYLSLLLIAFCLLYPRIARNGNVGIGYKVPVVLNLYFN